MNEQREKYNNEIKDLKQSFMNALDQYKDAYVISKMNPDDENYNSNYEAKKDELERILLKMTALRSTLESNIENISNIIFELENKTISEKNEINKISEKVSDLNDSKMGSKTFASDLNTLTGKQRLENKGMVVGIIMLGVIILGFHKL